MPVLTTPVSTTDISVKKAKIDKKIDKVGLEMRDLNKLLQPLNGKVVALAQKLRGLKKDQKKLDKSLVAATDSQSSESDSESDSDPDIADEKTTTELECDKKIQAMQIMHKNELDAARALMKEQFKSYNDRNYNLIATITRQDSQIKTLKLKNQASVGSKTLPVMKNNTQQLKPNSAIFTPVKPVTTIKDVDKSYDDNYNQINDTANNVAGLVVNAIKSAHSLNNLNRDLSYQLLDARSKLSNTVGSTTNNTNQDSIAELKTANNMIKQLEEKLQVSAKDISTLRTKELEYALQYKLALAEKHNEIELLRAKIKDHIVTDLARQLKNPSSLQSVDESSSSASSGSEEDVIINMLAFNSMSTATNIKKSSSSSSSGSEEDVPINMLAFNSMSTATNIKKSSSNNTQDSENVNIYDNITTADYSNVGVNEKLYNIVVPAKLKADTIKNDSRTPLTTDLPLTYPDLAIPSTTKFGTN